MTDDPTQQAQGGHLKYFKKYGDLNVKIDRSTHVAIDLSTKKFALLKKLQSSGILRHALLFPID